MYIVVFFLLLWSLFQLILCGSHQYTVYIGQTNDPFHEKINVEFMHNLLNILYSHNNPGNTRGPRRPLDTMKLTILEKYPSNITEFMNITKGLTYVVHLYVGDFYQSNFNNVEKNNFIWAGDVNKTEYNEKFGIETVENNNIQTTHVKLVSEKVTDIPFLYNLVRDFPKIPEAVRIRHKILLLHENPFDISRYNVEMRFGDVIKVIEFTHRYSVSLEELTDVIAILAPNPSWIDETDKPVIFYGDAVIAHDTDAFKNSIANQPSMTLMSHAFLEFFRKMKWNRFAIVSDDSEKSQEFEEILRSMLADREMSYTVKSVVNKGNGYDFNEVLASLKIADARIIIANVAPEQAKQLAKQASYHKLTESQKVLWIGRDWSETAAKEAAEHVDTVFSMVPQNNLRGYLDGIRRVISRNWQNEDYNFFDNSRFANDIRELILDPASFDVFRTTPSEHEVVLTFNQGIGILRSSFQVLPDKNHECSLRSKTYEKPCDDINLILLLLVVTVLSVSILGITYFFSTPDLPYNRMAS